VLRVGELNGGLSRMEDGLWEVGVCDGRLSVGLWIEMLVYYSHVMDLSMVLVFFRVVTDVVIWLLVRSVLKRSILLCLKTVSLYHDNRWVWFVCDMVVLKLSGTYIM